MYNKTVLDHFQNPRNLREMPHADAVGMGANRVCGDVMTLFLELDGERIRAAHFKTMGCGAAIASGSILTEMLKGMTVADAAKLEPKVLVDKLGGLPAIKMHCPELAVEALRLALKDHAQKTNGRASSHASRG